GVVGGKVELADDPVSLRPGLHAAKLDAMRQPDLLDASDTPIEVEMPPGAAVFAVGRELQPDLLLLAHDRFDLAVLGRLEVGRGDRPFRVLGARILIAAERRIEPT